MIFVSGVVKAVIKGGFAEAVARSIVGERGHRARHRRLKSSACSMLRSGLRETPRWRLGARRRAVDSEYAHRRPWQKSVLTCIGQRRELRGQAPLTERSRTDRQLLGWAHALRLELAHLRGTNRCRTALVGLFRLHDALELVLRLVSNSAKTLSMSRKHMPSAVLASSVVRWP
jgi:hypothetical protein